MTTENPFRSILETISVEATDGEVTITTVVSSDGNLANGLTGYCTYASLDRHPVTVANLTVTYIGNNEQGQPRYRVKTDVALATFPLEDHFKVAKQIADAILASLDRLPEPIRPMVQRMTVALAPPEGISSRTPEDT